MNEVVTLNRACHGGGQDRLVVRQQGDSLIVALADGAGGVGGGATAAQFVVDEAERWGPLSSNAEELLGEIDRRLAATGGQSTAIVLALSPDGIVGASVGDSGAWIVRGGAVEDLTGAQIRKPLIGSGAAEPVAFTAGPLRGDTLLLASDGLFKYARRNDIVRVAGQADLNAAATDLLALVTLRSGGLPDDVAVVLCR